MRARRREVRIDLLAVDAEGEDSLILAAMGDLPPDRRPRSPRSCRIGSRRGFRLILVCYTLYNVHQTLFTFRHNIEDV